MFLDIFLAINSEMIKVSARIFSANFNERKCQQPEGEAI